MHANRKRLQRRSGYDINRISGTGCLIIPLSMSRLATGQSPEETYKILEFFPQKYSTYTNDVIFLYTSGLYNNSEELVYEDRVKMLNQMFDHATRLRKLITKKKQFIPKAFHYLPYDYIHLNSQDYATFFTTLKKTAQTDAAFRESIQRDIDERGYSAANENFILEELVVYHLIRERLVDLPRGLADTDDWRLIVYPGPYLESDKYQWQQRLLPQTDQGNPFRASMYDFAQKKLFVYSDPLESQVA